MNTEGKKLETGLVWRTRLTGIIGVGWIAFLVLWLFFYASEFDIYKNIAIVAASLIGAGAVVGVIWGSAMKGMGSCKDAFSGVRGLAWRMLLSMIVMIVSLAFFLVWFYFFAVDYSGYENLGILIVQNIVTFSILGATWMSFKPEGVPEMPECSPDGC